MNKININNNLSTKIKKFVTACFYCICEARFSLTSAEKSGILYIEIREIVNFKIRNENGFYK